MRRLYALLPLLLLGSMTVTAQEFDTVRVCTYNVLNFGGGSNDRLDELRMILNEIRPRILLVQEIESEAGHILFRDSIAAQLDIPLQSTGLLSQDQDSYSVIFFDASTFESNEAIALDDSPRDAITVRLYHQARGVGDSVQFITAHWKAGDSEEDEFVRFLNSEVVGDFINETAEVEEFYNFLFGGDLNVYSAEERGYLHLTIPPTNFLLDPIGQSNIWHDTPPNAPFHTQSTRDRQFGGGVSGGMDDRFDFLLVSAPLYDRYVTDSYTAFGNDGHHFDDSINALPNLAVGPVMAQALHDASDHLPVYLDLVFPRVTTDVPEQGLDKIERLDLADRKSQ